MRFVRETALSSAAMSNPRPMGRVRMWPSWRFCAAHFRFSQ